MIPDHTRLGHWILDGDLAHSHLLRFALKESNFTDTTVLLCVAMTTPWNIMDQLHNWATLLHDHIDKLRVGENIIAIQALNKGKSGSDFLFSCNLLVKKIIKSVNSDFSIDYPLINPTNQNQLPSQFYRVISQ